MTSQRISKDFVLSFLLFSLSHSGFGQTIDVDINDGSGSNDFGTAVISFSPRIRDGYAESSNYSVEYVITSFRRMSGDWLLGNAVIESPEEIFARKWFLTYFKDPENVLEMSSVLEDSYFRSISEDHSNGSFPTEFELKEAQMYSDIRMLAHARYGNQHIFFADLKPVSDKIEVSGFIFIAVKDEAGYRAISQLDNATMSLLFGYIPLELQRELRHQLGIE